VDAASREGPSLEVVLVDNASETPMGEVGRRHPTVNRIAARRNLGFAAGCRLGVESAQAPVVLFVNDDAAVAPQAGSFAAVLARSCAGADGELPAPLARWIARRAQAGAQRARARARLEALRRERQVAEVLAFSGSSE